MIGLGKTTGYDIKQLVDNSTRHFWAASYGQIYPELRRLEAAGLLRSRSEPSGGRRRTIYEVTDAGRTALLEWLQSDQPPAWELRDEGLLKLFFSDLDRPERQLAVLGQIRAGLERKHAQLAGMERSLEEAPTGPRLTLDYGMRMTEAMIEWCTSTERRLAEDRAA